MTAAIAKSKANTSYKEVIIHQTKSLEAETVTRWLKLVVIMKAYNEFKKKSKEGFKSAQKDLAQEMQDDRDDLVEGLMDMLEGFKVTDPTPEERDTNIKLQINFFKGRANTYYTTAAVAFLLFGSIFSNFAADIANPDLSHLGRTSKYDPTKLNTHYNKLMLFWQFRDIKNVTNRIPADRRGEEMEPCGSTKGGTWPNCLARCLEVSECALEENYFLDCFPTCPQMELSGALDARFYIKRYSSSNAKGYFKQQVEILNIKEEIEKWEAICKIDPEGSCTDLSQITNKGATRVYMEACDVPLDTTIMFLGFTFFVLCIVTPFRASAYKQMLAEYMQNYQLNDITPIAPSLSWAKPAQKYTMGLIFMAFIWHILYMFSVETCRYKQPELYNVGIIIIYVVSASSLLYSLFFVRSNTASKDGYKLSRTGIAFICSVTFLFPFYEIVFYRNHTICIIKEEPEGIIARGCQWIIIPIGAQALYVIIGMAATATSNRIKMIKLYKLYLNTCFAVLVTIAPYAYLFMNTLLNPEHTDNYLTIARDQYCFQKKYPQWPTDTKIGRWDGTKTSVVKYSTNLDGKTVLQRPSDYDLSVKGSCMPTGIQPWDIFNLCNQGMEKKVNYSLGTDPNRPKPSYDPRFELFSCRLCRTTKSCSDSGTKIFRQDGTIASQNAIICTLSMYTALLGMVFGSSIVMTITKEVATKRAQADEYFTLRLKSTLGSRPSEIRWRDELGLPHMWKTSDEEFLWEQYFQVMYEWRHDNLCWRNAITSSGEWRDFAVYGNKEAQDIARERVFMEYIQGVMAYKIVDKTESRNWEKLQPAKGPVMPLEKRKMIKLQTEYSAKYNRRWKKGKKLALEKQRMLDLLNQDSEGQKGTGQKSSDVTIEMTGGSFQHHSAMV